MKKVIFSLLFVFVSCTNIDNNKIEKPIKEKEIKYDSILEENNNTNIVDKPEVIYTNHELVQKPKSNVTYPIRHNSILFQVYYNHRQLYQLNNINTLSIKKI